MNNLSDKSALFIRKYVINNIKHSNPLTEDDIVEITEYITTNYETGLLDREYNKPMPGYEDLYQQAVDTNNELFNIDDINLVELTKKVL